MSLLRHIFEFDLAPNMRGARGAVSFDSDGFIRDASDSLKTLTGSNTASSPIAGSVIASSPIAASPIIRAPLPDGGVNAKDIAEVSVIAGVGAGVLCVSMKSGEELAMCRFTMSGLKPAGEFCKIVNHCVKTGQAIIPDRGGTPTFVCPQCGRRLVEGMTECIFCYNRAGLLKRAARQIKPQSRKLLQAESILSISSALYLAVPLLSRLLVDNVLAPRKGGVAEVLVFTVGMLLARTIGELLYVFSSRRFNEVSIEFSSGLRNAIYDKLSRLSMNSLSKRTPGDLIRRVMEDTAIVKDFLLETGRVFVDMTIVFTVTVTILLFTNWRLALIAFAPVPLAMFALSRFWRLILVRYERQWRKNSKNQSILHDIIKGIRTVKSFGAEDAEIRKFAQVARDLAEVSSSNERLWALLFPSLLFFTGAGEFLVLFFGGHAVLAGSLSLGALLQFTMFIAYIYEPLRWIVSIPRRLADAMTSMVKVFEILDEKPDIVAAEDIEPPPAQTFAGTVRYDGVTFGYKAYEPVIKGVDLVLKPGETLGVVGKSGVGKSSLINLLLRLYDPNTGSVSVGGVDLRDMPPNALHENTGAVFQDTFLFAGSIFDNIAYAKPSATPEEIIAACKIANAHDFIMRAPDGYDTAIGENGHTLSGGERQRLAIARAVIKNPSILILDEATSSLDVETESLIQESLARATQGRTTIAIAHRLSTLRRADRILVLDNGRVAEIGSHAELMQARGIYFDLVTAQLRISGGADRRRQGGAVSKL